MIRRFLLCTYEAILIGLTRYPAESIEKIGKTRDTVFTKQRASPRYITLQIQRVLQVSTEEKGYKIPNTNFTGLFCLARMQVRTISWTVHANVRYKHPCILGLDFSSFSHQLALIFTIVIERSDEIVYLLANERLKKRRRQSYFEIFSVYSGREEAGVLLRKRRSNF